MTAEVAGSRAASPDAATARVTAARIKLPDRTKIVCTLGPVTATHESIGALLDAGMDVARINFSHGTHEEHARTISIVRQLAAERGVPVAILGDLQGPRIRIGDVAAPIRVDPGQEVVLSADPAASDGAVPVTYDGIARDVHAGDRILIDDGLIELVAVEVREPQVRARVLHGGEIRSHKGLNLPGVNVSAPAITEKDRADAAFAVEQGLDYLAMSFVRRAADIDALRQLVGSTVLIVAKIEKDSALDDIDAIARTANAVMVARGDLGVELPFEEVPLVQKRLIRLANRLGRPVITATQMLESMVEHPRPTRAEASDVANALLDGTDAVMLSAETALGAFPTLAVQAMHRIIAEIESRQVARPRDERRTGTGEASVEETIAAATVTAVRMLGVPLVVVFTKSGFTARIVSSHRPDVPILGLTDVGRTYNQLALVWGVIPALVPHSETYAQMFEHARGELLRRSLAKPGDKVLVTAGVPFDVPGTTNLLKVEIV